MTILEFLSSQLDREKGDWDTQQAFVDWLDFWNLCFEARRILLEVNNVKQEDRK